MEVKAEVILLSTKKHQYCQNLGDENNSLYV